MKRIGWFMLNAALIFAAIYTVAELAAIAETAHFQRAGL